eukprot:1176601-Pyramimonas_sp.AAC.1
MGAQQSTEEPVFIMSVHQKTPFMSVHQHESVMMSVHQLFKVFTSAVAGWRHAAGDALAGSLATFRRWSAVRKR